MNVERVLQLAVDMGCNLMVSGAEIYRVEESMSLLLRAYGAADAEVFAIPHCIIVSVTTPDGRPITRMRRIGVHGTDIEVMERCNDLNRLLCAQTPPVEQAHALLRSIEGQRRRYTPVQTLLGYGLSPAFFAPLFGGGWQDMGCAALTGLLVGLFQVYGARLFGGNSFLHILLSSAAASVLALGLVGAGIGARLDVITISALMMLVPGVAVTNAMREIMAGDTLSSLTHAANALLSALAIALGTAVGIGLIQYV